MTELLTSRLRIKELTEDDSDFILRLLNSPTWIDNIGDRHIRQPKEAKEFIRNGPMEAYAQLGHGLWRVSLVDTDEPIGICGLLKRDSLPYMDLGLAFLPQFTGSGYATEASTLCIRYAFHELETDEILAVTHPNNERALKLLKRLKFTYQREIPFEDGEKLQLYCLKEAI